MRGELVNPKKSPNTQKKGPETFLSHNSSGEIFKRKTESIFDKTLSDMYCSQPPGGDGGILASHLVVAMASIFVYIYTQVEREGCVSFRVLCCSYLFSARVWSSQFGERL